MEHFIPYGQQWIDQDDIHAVEEALSSNYLTTGPKVKAFEEAIAAYCHARYCVAVANGTAALHLASLTLLKKGDKVLTTPNSFLATSNAILYAGAEPVFIDIAEDGNIDLDICEKVLREEKGIRALYAVAFSGHMIDQKKLRSLRERYNIVIVEDCAHAIGAQDGSVKAASCTNSDISILSFHPVKHMTTGEGGAITTNDKALYDKLCMLRNHGMVKTPEMKPWEYEMRALGFNYRITDIQCALGLSQLKKLDTFIARRIVLAKQYDEAFKGTEVKPLYRYDGMSSYHLYVVRIDLSQKPFDKAVLFEKLRAKNIGVQMHYIPINKQPYYRELGYDHKMTPVMNRYYEEALSLPMYPKLTDAQQTYVIHSLLEILNV
jgi:UDP-4-amino-4,6-dideoxy-N-acetyl-beta-L-altrosamine transaminase